MLICCSIRPVELRILSHVTSFATISNDATGTVWQCHGATCIWAVTTMNVKGSTSDTKTACFKSLAWASLASLEAFLSQSLAVHPVDVSAPQWLSLAAACGLSESELTLAAAVSVAQWHFSVQVLSSSAQLESSMLLSKSISNFWLEPSKFHWTQSTVTHIFR